MGPSNSLLLSLQRNFPFFDEPFFLNLCESVGDIFPSMIFEQAIWFDAQDVMSEYVTNMIADSLLLPLRDDRSDPPSYGPFSTIRLAPEEDRKEVFRRGYRIYRLSEYKAMRLAFPELLRYRVERSETRFDRIPVEDRFLVQVKSTGYYMKRSTLMKCSYFNAMLSVDMTENKEGRCHLHTNEPAMFPEETFGAILDSLAGRRIDFEKHHWLDVLFAADYIGYDETKLEIDYYIARTKNIFDLTDAVSVLHRIETEIGWDLPTTATICIEIIKSNLIFLADEHRPFPVIGLLSYRTIKEILSDRRLVYFTNTEKKYLLDKWIFTCPNQVDITRKETLLGYIDEDDKTCSSLNLQIRKHACDDIVLEELINPELLTACRCSLKPAIIVVGGTGEGVITSMYFNAARPITPSTSVMAYSIRHDSWHLLPDMPFGMLKPILASNSSNEIYILDSHAFREQGAIHEHCLLTLKFNRKGFHWSSTMFRIPLGLCITQMTHIFYFEKVICFLGVANVPEKLMNEWSHGEQHRRDLLRDLRGSPLGSEKGVVVLFGMDLNIGHVELLKFFFHVDMDSPCVINACIADRIICVETRYGYMLGSTPETTSQIYTTFDLHQGNGHCEKEYGIRGDYKTLVTNVNNNGAVAISVTGCCYWSEQYNDREGMELRRMNVPFFSRFTPILEDCHSTGFMTVMDNDEDVYHLGGYSVGSCRSLDRCLVYKKPISGYSRGGWKEKARIPRGVAHGGVIFTHMMQQMMTHHVECPHCKLYPTDVLQADTTRVNLPRNYAANLMATYPSDYLY